MKSFWTRIWQALIPDASLIADMVCLIDNNPLSWIRFYCSRYATGSISRCHAARFTAPP
jgi:hypothetical protein